MIDGHLQIAHLENVERRRRPGSLSPAGADRMQGEFVVPLAARRAGIECVLRPVSRKRSDIPGRPSCLTPTDDFIGQLKATNRQIVVIIAALSALELFLIYFLCATACRSRSRSISRDLKIDRRAVVRSGGASLRPRSGRSRSLQSAAALLRNSLQSFSAFAPVEAGQEA